MKFISAKDQFERYEFDDAVLAGLAPDGGLFIPDHIPTISPDLIKHNSNNIYQLSHTILSQFLDHIPDDVLHAIIRNAFSFDIPLRHLNDNLYLLEVFHGPTLAFKDVGARFMANLIEHHLETNNEHLTILVATSGDTGSAIANAFHRKRHIDVCVLYPSKKISHLQEMQMTTLGDNIHALEVQGVFDDCQKLVKQALNDNDLRKATHITTANSINLARLLPQITYHAWGVMQLHQVHSKEPILTVPSGNFGNLISAIYAKKMGLAIKSFIAATNSNHTFLDYLESGKYEPRQSVKTLSNAMDVGNPSNFERLLRCYDSVDAVRNDIASYAISDEETLQEIRHVYEHYGCIIDPHTAVGTAAYRSAAIADDQPVIVTSTAHPAKFPEVIKQAIGVDVELPDSLQKAMHGEKLSTVMPADYAVFKQFLLNS